MEKVCENCRYAQPFGDRLTCHRRAPVPYNALVFHIGELIRDIAWIIHVKEMGEEPDKYSELRKEATEASDYAVWPEVERDDFCGEWERGKDGRTADSSNRAAFAGHGESCGSSDTLSICTGQAAAGDT